MQPPGYMVSNAFLQYVVTAATRADRLVKSGYTNFSKSLPIRKEDTVTKWICLQSEQAYVRWFYLKMNSSWTESFLSHHKTKFLHVKVSLLPCRPLFLKPVTFDHSPHLTVLQHISCVSSWHVLLLARGISCSWLLVLSCPAKQSHHPVNRHQGGNGGCVIAQSWKVLLLHMGSFDGTSLVVSLSYDRCRYSKGQSRCLCALSWHVWSVSCDVSVQNGLHSTWHENAGSRFIPKGENVPKQALIPRQEVATEHYHVVSCLIDIYCKYLDMQGLRVNLSAKST